MYNERDFALNEMIISERGPSRNELGQMYQRLKMYGSNHDYRLCEKPEDFWSLLMELVNGTNKGQWQLALKIFEELQDGQNQIELTVSGMSAGCCVREVRRLMERIPEVQKTEVVLDSGQIVLYGQKIPLEQVRNALTAAGFEVVI